MATSKKAENKVSIRAYARSLKVDEKAVRKAIEAGLIKKGYDAAVKKIIPSLADKEWGFKHETPKPQAGVSRSKALAKMEAKTGKNKSDTTEGKDVVDLEESVDELLNRLKITSGMTVQEAMRRREIIAAALDKKKLEEAEGVLVRKDKVEKALHALGSGLKKALFNMPQRIVRDIMTAPNEVEAINIFNHELTQTLTKYADLKLKIVD